MRLSFAGDRVLAIVAHPDDAELLCAGTLARAQADGASTGICVLCAGDKGQPAQAIADLAAQRKRETAAAAELLGTDLLWAGCADGTLTDSPPLRQTLLELVRTFAPTLILAHAPEDYHPDHRAAAALAEAVSWFCASRGHQTNAAPLAQPPALWWMDTMTMADFVVGFYVDISPYLTLKERMLSCHQSQLERSGDRDFSPLLDLMRTQAAARGLQAGVAAAEAFRANAAFKRGRAW